MRFFIVMIIRLIFRSEAVIKMLNQLPFGDLASTNLASKVRTALVRVKVLFLVGNLIKCLVASVDRALKRFFAGVGPQMVKETLRLLEEFSALGVIARVHSCISLSI